MSRGRVAFYGVKHRRLTFRMVPTDRSLILPEPEMLFLNVKHVRHARFSYDFQFRYLPPPSSLSSPSPGRVYASSSRALARVVAIQLLRQNRAMKCTWKDYLRASSALSSPLSRSRPAQLVDTNDIDDDDPTVSSACGSARVSAGKFEIRIERERKAAAWSSANCRDDDDGEGIYLAGRAAAAALIPKRFPSGTLAFSKNSESASRGGGGDAAGDGGGDGGGAEKEQGTGRPRNRVGVREGRGSRTERDTRNPGGTQVGERRERCRDPDAGAREKTAWVRGRRRMRAR